MVNIFFPELFQSLIGRLKTAMDYISKFKKFLFQSLIGRLKTRAGRCAERDL